SVSRQAGAAPGSAGAGAPLRGWADAAFKAGGKTPASSQVATAIGRRTAEKGDTACIDPLYAKTIPAPQRVVTMIGTGLRLNPLSAAAVSAGIAIFIEWSRARRQSSNSWCPIRKTGAHRFGTCPDSEIRTALRRHRVRASGSRH